MLIDIIQIFARWGIYLGVIGTAGTIFTVTTLWPSNETAINRAFIRQANLAGIILLVSLIVNFILFLYAISGRDWQLALSADYVLVGLNSAVGRSFLLKLVGGIFILLGFRLRAFWLEIIGALFIVSSFGFEGHSVSFGTRPYVTALLLAHLSLISWWLAVIWPLMAAQGEERKKFARRFSNFAVYFVPLTIVTGLGMWYSYTGGIDLRDPYQIRLGLKLLFVFAILGVAVGNKLIFTERDQLKWPLRAEALFALGATLFTAILITVSPSG